MKAVMMKKRRQGEKFICSLFNSFNNYLLRSTVRGKWRMQINVDKRDKFFPSKAQKQMLEQVGSKHTLLSALPSNPQLSGSASFGKSAPGMGSNSTPLLKGSDLAIPVTCSEPETCGKLLRA